MYLTEAGMEMVSIEYIIDLANLLNKDIWLSIPSGANDEYITNLATYVKSNFLLNKKIYVEQSSDKNFAQNSRTLELNLVKVWNAAFGKDSRVSHVIAISSRYFFNNPPVYLDSDYANFDAYSISGGISSRNPYNDNNFNVSLVDSLTEEDILDEIRQEIYKDEIDLIYLRQMVAIKMPNKPLLAYDVGFRVSAATYNNRWQNTSLAAKEQELEDLIISALQKPLVKELYLDFMERWYRIGGSTMFLSNLVDYVDRCVRASHRCNYQSTLISLTQTPQNVPKYAAAVSWLNNKTTSLPFTLADVAQPAKISCSPKCKWGTCFKGSCVCYDGYTGSDCSQITTKYLDCHPDSTQFGMNAGGLADW
jgi:hypothetical protein